MGLLRRTPLSRRAGTGLLRRTPLARRKRLVTRTRILRVSPTRTAPDRGPTVEYLDNIARELVFARDGYRCLMCGGACTVSTPRAKQPGTFTYIGIQWAHVRGSGSHATRWMVDNAMALCPGCHKFKWHDMPAGFDPLAWFEATRPGVLARIDAVLAEFKVTRRKPDRTQVAAELEPLLALLPARG